MLKPCRIGGDDIVQKEERKHLIFVLIRSENMHKSSGDKLSRKRNETEGRRIQTK